MWPDLQDAEDEWPTMIIKPKRLNPGDKTVVNDEEKMENVAFNIHKFSDRPRPDPKEITIYSCFSEFGCESLGIMYCIPRMKSRSPKRYCIAVGWYGRAYLYQHLVDEFWEIKEEHQWLREYARAFHHDSKNLTRIESALRDQAKEVVTASQMGQLAVGHVCRRCNTFWGDIKKQKECPRCKGDNIEPSILGDIDYWRQRAVHVPKPSQEVMNQAGDYLKKNPVGIFARGRKCYGRNLQPEFYVKLISTLEEMGYNPIWLGEKQSTLPCPVDHILDFSRMPEARNLELTLAIIAQLKFTVQFWTASTRLASMMGTPYLLFESPDQIWGMGQENYRRKACDFGPSKLVVAHYRNVFEDNEAGINLVKQAVTEMESENYSDLVGLVGSPEIIEQMKNSWSGSK